MTDTTTEAAVPSELFETIERQYMPEVLDGVRKRAAEIATEKGHKEANYVDIFRAFEQRFTGGIPTASQQQQSILRENLFLIIVVVLTIGFGLMGLLPYIWGTTDPSKIGYKPEVFLDIAKLFAGVLVGGAAGVASNAALASRRARV
jgi:hypothetical protein